jgi:concentrative nucleoside transporter, CNT family
LHRLVSLAGLAVFVLIAYLLSDNRRKMNWRLIVSGLVLQFVFAVAILRTTLGQYIFDKIRIIITSLISFSQAGSEFVFGAGFKEHFFAFSVLPTIIFVSSLMTVLFYLGILQKLVELMARIMVYVMDTSGSESLATAANIFMGMSEAPLVIKPYIKSMTRSELMAMMTGGMATISGATLAAFTGYGADAGHLLTASVISAPAALVIAKIMVPETETSLTKGTVKIKIPKQDINVLDAACRGATDGVKLAINIAGGLIAFIAFVALANWLLSFLPQFNGSHFTLERIFGWICSPLAWLMGIEWKDASTVGALLGKRTVLNEFIAYIDLGKCKDIISPRSFTITTYALCGFANFGSIAILIGGLGSIVPEKRADFARLGFKAMLAGMLACFMTAAIAGVLI